MSLEITSPPLPRAPVVRALRPNRRLSFSARSLRYLQRHMTWRNLAASSVGMAFAALLLLFAHCYAQLVFTIPVATRDSGVAHTVFISKFVREMPVFKPLEDSARYFFNLWGNESIPDYILRYQSNAPAEEIVSFYRLYFEILNYSFIDHSFDSKVLAIFRNTREEFTVFVSVSDAVNTVSIENIHFD